MAESFPKVAKLKTVVDFKNRLAEIGVAIPVDDRILSAEQGSPLASPIRIGRHTAGNRWCIHPMEGWDANRDGSPGKWTIRRWERFGLSGAKLIWGGEAAAVRPDGRANPNQTLATESNRNGLRRLLFACREAHQNRFGNDDDLVVGLQLTHSGRFCRPNDDRLEPRLAYHHPLLAQKYGISCEDQSLLWTDAELETLIEDYVSAARLAGQVGFQFVDIKACHGYLLHEFLSARTRSGSYGGDLAGRTRLLRTIIERIRNDVPDLDLYVRLSLFDSPPFETSREVGRPMDYQAWLPYQYGFGVDQDDPFVIDLAEPLELLKMLREMGVAAINVTGGSPYYNPHWQRPAAFPPSDGYLPPEDPLCGVARHLDIARQCKQAVPEMVYVGTGYSYLQDYLPHVAQAVVKDDWIDLVGIGRLVLSYPDLPADVLAGSELQRKLVCRTFSDCTTAPRNGLPSGCYPLDKEYKASEQFQQLVQIKAAQK